MRLGLDIHQLGGRLTGNETYVRNLLEQYSQFAEPAELELYHTRLAPTPQGSPWRGRLHQVHPHSAAIRIPFSLPWALWRDRVDLAHFQYVAPPLCPCPTVVTVHDISYEFFPHFFHPLQRLRMRTLIPFSARRAQAVITISEFSRRQLVEHYRLPEDKVSVTWLAASRTFRVIDDTDWLDIQLERFKINGPYLLGVGNLQPRKNLPCLIRAFARLRQSGYPHQLVLVGQLAWHGHEVGHEIERLGLGDAVRVTGYVSEPELVSLYNRATLFAYPSIYEGFGLPIVEAMACGTPVLTSRVASMPEVAGNAAVLIDPLSEDELHDGLRQMLDHADGLEQLRRLGLDRALLFDWHKTAQQTLDIYQRSLS